MAALDKTFVGSLRSLFAQVEQISGKKMKIAEKRGMRVPVHVRVARQDMLHHIFYLDPYQQDTLPHALAHECVRLIRLFQVEAEKRVVPVSLPEMRERAYQRMDDAMEGKSGELSQDTYIKMREFWFDSIVRQLTNYPIDIRIEQWLYRFYPELRPLQMRALVAQSRRAAEALSLEVQSLTPDFIFEAANTMHAAYFSILGKTLELELDQAFRNTPYAREARKLVALIEDEQTNSYEADVGMIHLWAEFFDLTDWFAWIDLEAIPA